MSACELQGESNDPTSDHHGKPMGLELPLGLEGIAIVEMVVGSSTPVGNGLSNGSECAMKGHACVLGSRWMIVHPAGAGPDRRDVERACKWSTVGFRISGPPPLGGGAEKISSAAGPRVG